jgi:hypothetical protein
MTRARDLSKLLGTNNNGVIDNTNITLDANEIPNLDTAKITTGTFADARISAGSVSQHVDLSNLNASNLTSGTIASARINNSSLSAISALPAGVGGKVLQVVSTTVTTASSIASYIATDIPSLSVSITPSSASNKILVLYKIQYANPSGNNGTINLVRNGTNIAMGNAGQGGDDCTISICVANSNNYWSLEAGGSFLDSPSSTSALTYKFQTTSNDGAGIFYFNRTGRNLGADANGISTITVMEIAT